MVEAFCKCEKCGKEVKVDNSMVLTSNPPKYKYECPECKHIGYIATAAVYGHSSYARHLTSIQSNSNLGLVYNQSQDCHSCDHQHVCKYKEEFLKKLNSLDLSAESFIRLRCECIHYKQQTCNYREITWLNSSDPLDTIYQVNKDDCSNCDFMKKLINDGSYIGDSPCEWCSKNPYKVSCESNTLSAASTAARTKTIINETISTNTVAEEKKDV